MILEGKGSKAIIPQQDIRQLEPVDIFAFHDKKGMPRDAAPVLAVLFGSLDAISSYHDDKYGARRVDWMAELRKIGGRIDYFSPNKATIWGNEQWGYRAKDDNTVLNGTDIRSAASLLLAASTSDIPVTINGLRHIKRSYTNLPNKMSKLGTEVIYQHS
jgi:UDP-N-acetylglucosamine enolpyruvyl transferase